VLVCEKWKQVQLASDAASPRPPSRQVVLPPGRVLRPPSGPFGTTTALGASRHNTTILAVYDGAAQFLKYGAMSRICAWTGSWWSPMFTVTYGMASQKM
jgi:hypothetical protein